MDLGIKGRVALVTGASGGLGLAVAIALASDGAKVAICSRSRERIDAAAAQINASAGAQAAVGFVADLSNSDARDGIVDQVAAAMGPIEIAVINSGGPPSGTFESHPQDRWMGTVDEHLGSVLAITRGVLPAMRRARWGRIVAITSCSVKQPAAGMILSNTARGAVVGFIRTLANEVAADGITVNNVMPGYTLTDRIGELADQIAHRSGIEPAAVIDGWRQQIPMGRLGRPEEFAAMTAFLCSANASYVTGTSVSVDGGWNRGLF